MLQYRTKHCRFIVFVSIFFTSITANALEFQPNASLAMQHTNNSKKVNTNNESDLIMTTSIGASINSDTGPFQLDANTLLKHKNYTKDTFSDQQYFNLKTTAGWEMLKNRVDWQLKDFFTQQSIDTLGPDTPDNTQDTNVLTFGPNIRYQMTDRHSLTFVPEYRKFSYEIQNIDNRQNALDASWTYKIFRTMNIGLRGGTNKITYEDPLLTNNTFKNMHLTLSATRSNYNYSAAIGSTKVDREGRDSTQSLTGNFNLATNLSGRSNLRTFISKNLTDTNTALLNASINPDTEDFTNQQISSEASNNRIFRMTYNRRSSTLNSDVWFEIRKQTSTLALTREIQATGMEFNHSITALLSTGIKLRYNRVQLTGVNRKDNEYNLSSNLNYRFTRRLLGTVDLGFTGKDDSLNIRNFRETSVYISLIYTHGK